MTRADHIHQARVYLAQARATPHRGWRMILLSWAAKRRFAAMAATAQPPRQLDIFNDSKESAA
ncbi:hypothetical protein FQZ97_1161230 [compost metagenome]